MAEKAAYIRLGVRSGMKDLDSIQNIYNEYKNKLKDGGTTKVVGTSGKSYGSFSSKDEAIEFADYLNLPIYQGTLPELEVVYNKDKAESKIMTDSYLRGDAPIMGVMEALKHKIAVNDALTDLELREQAIKKADVRHAMNVYDGDKKAKDITPDITDLITTTLNPSINLLSPSQQVGALIDMAQGEGYWNNIALGNSGLLPDKFAEEYPITSLFVNALADAKLYKGAWNSTRDYQFRKTLNEEIANINYTPNIPRKEIYHSNHVSSPNTEGLNFVKELEATRNQPFIDAYNQWNTFGYTKVPNEDASFLSNSLTRYEPSRRQAFDVGSHRKKVSFLNRFLSNAQATLEGRYAPLMTKAQKRAYEDAIHNRMINEVIPRTTDIAKDLRTTREMLRPWIIEDYPENILRKSGLPTISLHKYFRGSSGGFAKGKTSAANNIIWLSTRYPEFPNQYRKIDDILQTGAHEMGHIWSYRYPSVRGLSSKAGNYYGPNLGHPGIGIFKPVTKHTAGLWKSSPEEVISEMFKQKYKYRVNSLFDVTKHQFDDITKYISRRFDITNEEARQMILNMQSNGYKEGGFLK